MLIDQETETLLFKQNGTWIKKTFALYTQTDPLNTANSHSPHGEHRHNWARYSTQSNRTTGTETKKNGHACHKGKHFFPVATHPQTCEKGHGRQKQYSLQKYINSTREYQLNNKNCVWLRHALERTSVGRQDGLFKTFLRLVNPHN